MKKLLIFSPLLIILIACQKEEEFNTDLIPGEYTGSVFYSPAIDSGGVELISSDPSKGNVFKIMVKRVGSNFVLSFDQSFNYSIPDLTVEIASSKNPNVVAITSIPGQAFRSLNRENTYMNEPSNYFSSDEFIRRVDCNLTIRSNDPDSISSLTFIMLRIY